MAAPAAAPAAVPPPTLVATRNVVELACKSTLVVLTITAIATLEFHWEKCLLIIALQKAISSPDYLYKFANKNLIIFRSDRKVIG